MTMNAVTSKPVDVPIVTGPEPAPPTRLEGPGALMPAPEPAIDIGAAVARMLIEGAFERRQIDRTSRNAAAIAAEAAGRAQVEHMREQANAEHDAAVLQATGKIAGGAVGVAGGLAPMLGEGMRNATLRELGPAVREGGPVASGLFDLAAAGATGRAGTARADAKADELRADAEKSRVDAEQTDVDASRDDIRTALEFLREFESTQAKSQSAALLRA